MKNKTILMRDQGSSQGCERSRLPHFPDNSLTDGGKVVIFKPEEDSWYSFPLKVKPTPGS